MSYDEREPSPEVEPTSSSPAPSATEADDFAALWAMAEAHLIRYSGNFTPMLIERAKGTYLYDTTGRAILDFTSGQMCATLGHNHPAVIEAIHKSCRDVLHLFSGLLSPAVVKLAARLTHLLPPALQKRFF